MNVSEIIVCAAILLLFTFLFVVCMTFMLQEQREILTQCVLHISHKNI